MRKLIAFMQLSLDGYFADPQGDMSWAHSAPDDAEWNAFVAGNASGGGELLFGRVTYELMASFWPTPLAAERMPVVADHMNQMRKTVFSRTLTEATWQNTRLLHGEETSGGLAGQVGKLKAEPGPGIAILGSGSLVAQLAAAELIDELQLVINPIALGGGRSLFADLAERLRFRLVSSRAFGNGNVLLCYSPRK